MKNFLILGLLALLLFSVSAALSLWLNKQPPETVEKKDPKEPPSKHGNDPTDKSDSHSHPAPVKHDGPTPPVNINPAREALALQDKASLRAAQIDVVSQDLLTQNAVVTAMLRQVASESRLLGEDAAKIDAKLDEIKRQNDSAAPGVKKNVEKTALMYEAMAPEDAAKALKDLADDGQLDSAAKMLAQMTPRKAGAVLGAMAATDSALAAALTKKILTLRPPTPPGPPAGNGTPVTPGTGP